jgi:hypothetical protein
MKNIKLNLSLKAFVAIAGMLKMIISEQQVMQLMSIANHYIELISLISMNEIKMNYPQEHQEIAVRLLATIKNQQCQELNEIE